MSNTINVNGVTGYYNSFIQSATKKSASTKTATNGTQEVSALGKYDFKSAIESKVEVSSTNNSQKVDQTEAVYTKDMTLEEYKEYIHNKISELPWHPSNLCDSWAINISEEGFKAMKDDPEYEQWVLDDLKKAFTTPYPEWARSIGGARYVVAHIGATKDDCRADGWHLGYKNGTGDKVWEAKSKGSFWTKRGEQMKIQDRIDKKAAEKKELEKKWLKESAEKRQAYTDSLIVRLC